MSISSTGLYGSATNVNSDLFTDVETLKETVTTLNMRVKTKGFIKPLALGMDVRGE